MKEKIVKMQYPYSNDTNLYDGLEHKIVPMKLMPVTLFKKKYYSMIYKDLRYNLVLLALLAIEKGQLLNVPLDEEGYRLLGQWMIDHRYLEYDASEFSINNPIGLTAPIELANYRKK